MPRMSRGPHPGPVSGTTVPMIGQPGAPRRLDRVSLQEWPSRSGLLRYVFHCRRSVGWEIARIVPSRAFSHGRRTRGEVGRHHPKTRTILTTEERNFEVDFTHFPVHVVPQSETTNEEGGSRSRTEPFETCQRDATGLIQPHKRTLPVAFIHLMRLGAVLGVPGTRIAWSGMVPIPPHLHRGCRGHDPLGRHHFSAIMCPDGTLVEKERKTLVRARAERDQGGFELLSVLSHIHIERGGVDRWIDSWTELTPPRLHPIPGKRI